MWSATSQRTGAPFFTTTASPTKTTRPRPPTSTGRPPPEQHAQHTQQDDQPNPKQPPKEDHPRPGVLSKKTSRASLQKKSSFSRIRRGSSSVVGFASDTRAVAPEDDRARKPQQQQQQQQQPHVRAKSVSSVPAGSNSQPPALPVGATPAAASSLSGSTAPKMMGTSLLLGPYASSSYSTTASAMMSSSVGQPPESVVVHQHIHDVANKRISTMDYLRKAQEGRVYWFNTLRYDRPDLARMPYFDPRRLARRATNYLLLGLSIPAVVDLNSTSAGELLRSFGALLAEFESFQQLHAETGSGSGGASSLSRAARLPHMFRRATPGSKVRRTSSSATASEFDGGASPVGGSTSPGAGLVGSGSSGGGGGGGSGGSGGVASLDGTIAGSALTLVTSESAGSLGGAGMPLTPTPSHGQGHGHGHGHGYGPAMATTPSGGDPLSVASTPLAATASTPGTTSFATYYDNNTDLLPGEEYTLLLTPSLPFDPDFFETFATLCDVLIDCYARILSLLPTPRECTPVVVELFNKADARVRKLLVQGVVKEFEDNSRAGVKTEVANIGRVVLGGLMG